MPAVPCPCGVPLLVALLDAPAEPWALLATAVAPPAAEPAAPDVVEESPPPPPQAVRANREEARATAMALDWKGEREAVDFMAAPDRSGWKDDRKLAAWPSASHPNWCDMKSLSTDRQDGSEGMHGCGQTAGRPRPDGLSWLRPQAGRHRPQAGRQSAHRTKQCADASTSMCRRCTQWQHDGLAVAGAKQLGLDAVDRAQGLFTHNLVETAQASHVAAVQQHDGVGMS